MRGNSKNRFERFETAFSIPHAPVGVAVDLVVDINTLALLAADGVGEHDRQVAAVVLERVCGSNTRRQPARGSQCAEDWRPQRHEAMSTSYARKDESDSGSQCSEHRHRRPVSYTHLTLPTILLV